MAIGELLSAIEREAAAEVRALRDAASADAARVLAEAVRARESNLDASVLAFRVEHGRNAERAIVAAERRWRGQVLAARAAALERLLVATRAALPAQLDARVACTLLDAALASLGDDPATVRCSPAVAAAVRERVADRPSLRVVDDLAESGAVVERGDGVVRIDATLEAVLDAAWPELRQHALPEDAS